MSPTARATRSASLTCAPSRSRRPFAVGSEPTGIAANSKKNEIYVVNSGSSNVSVIDAETNAVVATIGVHGRPYFIDVSEDGKRAYVANSGIVQRQRHRSREADRRSATYASAPRRDWRGFRPDGSTVVVSNRGDNTVSLIDAKSLRVRATLPVCQQPEDVAILPDSSKAFVSCSGSSQVASIRLQNRRGAGQKTITCSPCSMSAAPQSVSRSSPTAAR